MRTKLEIKRIDLWSLFKISFFLYAAFGLIVGFFYAFFILLAGGLGFLTGEELPEFGIFGGIFALVLIPILALFYGAIGSVFLTIGGFMFNVIAGATGGIRFDTEVVMEEPPAAIYSRAEPPGPAEPDDSGPVIDLS